jgi:ATP-dependent exoDNAse (exonuclease V) beta subunit
MNNPVHDQVQRTRAITPTESFIVQAPAGSGKTELLIQRLLRLLAVTDHPEEVLAITFTRKAAAEMQERVLSALEQARTGTSPPDASARLTLELAAGVLRRGRERGWELEHNPGRLRIQTIDSLCARLTRQMPVLSRLGAQPETVEDARRHYREAASATLGELEDGGAWSESIAVLLEHLDNDLPRIRDLIANLLARRDQWLAHVARPDRRELEGALARLAESTLRAARESFPAAIAADLAILLRHAAETADASEPLACFLQLHALPDARAEMLPAWQSIAGFLLTANGEWRKMAGADIGFAAIGRGSGSRERRAWKGRYATLLAALAEREDLRRRLVEIRRLPPPRYPDSDWRVVEALCRLLQLADAQLTVLFAERNQIDFTGITRAAIAALGSDDAPTDLALSLDFAIHHILVDEFQDISAQQFRLLQRLTAGWTPGDGRSLFLVGDPMQSIYGFREADVGLFIDTWQRGRLGQVALTPLDITVNFRSDRAIVEWVNRVFGRVLPPVPDAARGAVAYAPADPFHDDRAETAVKLYALRAEDGEDGAEAALVARIIRESAATVGRKTVVLVRNRSALEAIVPRLKREGLRFRAVEIEALGHRPAIQDLVALIRALCHAADHAAWFALLRAPWCGLSLDDLLALADARGSLTLWECLHEEQRLGRMSVRGRAAAERIREVIAGAIAERGRRRFRRWIEAIWLRLGGPATLLEETDIENVRACFGLLDRLEAAGEAEDADRLAQQAAELFAAPDTGAGEELQIMTIHRAKGLEFDVVIIAGLARGRRRDPPSLLRWAQRARPDGGRDLLLAPIREAGAEVSPIYECLKVLEEEKQDYEEGRLIYVAATRARIQLHLIGSVKVDTGGVPAEPRSDSLLSRLWPGIRDEFLGKLAVAPPSAPANIRSGPAPVRSLRRLPPDWSPPVPLAPRVEVPAPLVQAPPPGTEIVFEWAGRTIQHVGTAFHRCVRLLAEDPDSGSAAGLRALQPLQRAMLRDLGVPPGELEQAMTEVGGALLNMIGDERGRWLIDRGHTEAHNEYAITGLYRGTLSSAVLDRTFVTADGVRWIVDYKTSRHEGGDPDAFLDRERERYRAQLEKYAELLGAMEARPIRLGLYFPLLKGWREWAFEDASTPD